METIYGSPIYFPGSTAADMCIFVLLGLVDLICPYGTILRHIFFLALGLSLLYN